MPSCVTEHGVQCVDLPYGDAWEQVRFTNDFIVAISHWVERLAAFAPRSKNGDGELGPIAKSKPVDGVVGPLTKQRDIYAVQRSAPGAEHEKM